MKKVLKDDYGIRPAGSPNKCFYCKQNVGDYHKNDCVVIGKSVNLSLNIEINSYSAYINKDTLINALVTDIDRLIDLLKNCDSIEVSNVNVKEINAEDTIRFEN